MSNNSITYISEVKEAFRQYLAESEDSEKRMDAESKFNDEWLMTFYTVEWEGFQAGYRAAATKLVKDKK